MVSVDFQLSVLELVAELRRDGASFLVIVDQQPRLRGGHQSWRWEAEIEAEVRKRTKTAQTGARERRIRYKYNRRFQCRCRYGDWL